MGSGKSTLSREISHATGAMLLSEDEWLKSIYPEEIESFEDYIKYSARLKPLLKSHVQDILNSGISVVMDFPGNTVKLRAWFTEIYAEHNFPHKLVYLDVSDSRCLEQLKKRIISHPERANFDTEKVFHQVNSFFEPPSESECFNIEVVYKDNE